MRLKIGALAVIVLLTSTPLAAELIKKSNSGLCHPPESAWYDRTKNFSAFDSIEACLESGGRLPNGLSLRALRAERNPTSDYRPYDRDHFRHWIDEDGDCQDTRAELLIAKSTIEPRFADNEKECRVVQGSWPSPFTGRILRHADDVEIDHVVPLKWAWERGAWRWSGQERETFANDMVNIMAVEDELNSSKSARGPDEWLPPSGQCGYVARFARVVKRYDLNPKAEEAQWLKRFLKRCQ